MFEYRIDYFLIELPGRYGIMVRHRNLLKNISWKDSYNAESKLPVKLRWNNTQCDHCRFRGEKK